MQFSEIDHQFEEALDRLQKKTAVAPNPYGQLPMAADHFLLKKSWDYFRGRVKMIEDQWRKMMEAKDQQLRATLMELRDARQRQVDLEEENNLLRSLDRNIKKVRAEDFVGFSRKSENLRRHWDSEREALERKIETLEKKVVQDKKNADLRHVSASIREEKLRETIDLLRREAQLVSDRERDIQKKCSDELILKDEKILSLDSKLEILRAEIDRRDQLLRQLKESISNHEKDSVAMTAYVAELQRALKDKDMELANLKTRIEILSQEKSNMHVGWERERAEWRELWDRSRSLYEKK